MNVTAAGPPTWARSSRAQPTPVETAPVAPEDVANDGTATRRGGSDTPFTHALEQGNGRKLGILKRMPTPQDVAVEQQAAGLGDQPTDATPVEGEPVVDGEPVVGEEPAADAPTGGTTTIDGTQPAIGSPAGDVPQLEVLPGVDDPTLLEALLDEQADAVQA